MEFYYFLGSSVTEGPPSEGSFVEILSQEYGLSCVKEAVSGTTLSGNGPETYVHRMERNLPPDLAMKHFICQLSTNDAAQNKPLGRISSGRNAADFDIGTVIGAMEYIISYIRFSFSCPISFYTNPPFANERYRQMIEALYQLRDKWNIGVLDFYQFVGMEPLPEETLRSYMVDEIHPNAKGYGWMAQMMYSYLRQYS